MINVLDLDSSFRNTTDLLFFSNRLDLNLSNYNNLLKTSNSHTQYLIDRFYKGAEIYWDNLSDLWNQRLSLLFSLNNSNIQQLVERHINKRMCTLLRKKQSVCSNDIEYIQYLEMCKVKWARKESLSFARNYLLSLPDSIKPEQIILIIKSFIPYVFKNLSEYSNWLCKRVIFSTKNLLILNYLNSIGVENDFSLLDEKIDLILKSPPNPKLSKAFIALLREEHVVKNLQSKINVKTIPKIIDLLAEVSYKELETDNYYIFRVLTKLDPRLIVPLTENYVMNLLLRGNKHLTSNCKKMGNLNKAVPACSSKVIFKYIVSLDKIGYIKSLCCIFPEYKDLLAFV